MMPVPRENSYHAQAERQTQKKLYWVDLGTSMHYYFQIPLNIRGPNYAFVYNKD